MSSTKIVEELRITAAEVPLIEAELLAMDTAAYIDSDGCLHIVGNKTMMKINFVALLKRAVLNVRRNMLWLARVQ